jgi:hypothetical protein
MFNAPPANGPDTQKETITLKNLTNNDIYLVQVNKSSARIHKENTGYVINTARSIGTGDEAGPIQLIPAYEDALISGFFEGKDGIITRLDHPGAREFIRNPPALSPANRNSGSAARSFQSPSFTSYNIDNSRTFWVQKNSKASGSDSSNWLQITAVLRASSERANVWIPDANYNASAGGQNMLSVSQAQAIANKFSLIYKYDTAIFGYEYGGNPKGPDYGGVDDDPKIQILVYDIDYDYKANQNSGIFGYFWGKDHEEYHTYSNEAEMFYIDSYFASMYPDAIYSTLAHEFQHMINFNVKSIEKGLSSNTWYNEMLSMLAEDMIAPLINIPTSSRDHPIQNRIPFFLNMYWYVAPTEWLDDNVLISYSNTYAFGAYLARNYGGAELIQEIARNNKVGIDSIDAALKKHGSSWDNALSKYGEAFIFSGTSKPSGGASFDKTITKNINGTNYTFAAFDIWEMANNHSSYLDLPSNNLVLNSHGPVVWDSGYIFDMPGYSVLVQSNPDWMNVSGNMTITLKKPSYSNIELYIITR